MAQGQDSACGPRGRGAERPLRVPPRGAAGFPGGPLCRRRTGTTGVSAEPGPLLTILGERRRRQQQEQQQRRQRRRGAHRALAAGPEQVAAGLAEEPRARAAGARAPLAEAWRWRQRPGGDPRLPSRPPAAPPLRRCRRAGLGRGARRSRSGELLRRGRCLRGCGRLAAAATPVPSAPAPAPSPRSAPPAAGPGGAGRGGRWAVNNKRGGNSALERGGGGAGECECE